MGNRPKDWRPRVLDFSANIEGTMPVRNLAWPCHAFRVTIPVRPLGRLNMFEEAVLKLLSQARYDEGALADLTCLDISLIRLVLCRLRDLGMLLEGNEVAELGRDQLAVLTEEPEDYEQRTLFREQISGKLLPVVRGGELRYEELIHWNRHTAVIQKSNHAVSLRMLPAWDGEVPNQVPSPFDVLWAINRHQALSRQYALLRRGPAPCFLAGRLSQINVSPIPERVYLRCRLVLPASGGDYRIVDPFGYGFSDLLFRAYEDLRARNSEEQNFVRDLRDSASTIRIRPPKANPAEREAEAAVLSRLSDAVRSYTELFARLQAAERELRIRLHPPKNCDEAAYSSYHGRQAAVALSEAVEAALGYVVAGSRRPACETLLGGDSQTQHDNGELLEKLAQRIGLRSRGIGGLLRVTPGRIRALRRGGVDLQALLAVAIAAAEETHKHPLRRLAAKFGNWLCFLRELKQLRDAGAHGQSRKESSQRLQELREGTYRTIEHLLPNLNRSVEAAIPAGRSSMVDQVQDERRQAVSRLEDAFGVKWYEGLHTDLAEQLIQIELAVGIPRSGNSAPRNVVRTINDLASLLQELIHSRQLTTAQEPSDSGPPAAVATSRAVAAGLLATGAPLPPCLAKVDPRRLNEAMQGRSPSLGANVMALLLLAPPETLQQLASRAAGFLELSARVIEQRGHGNRPVFMTAEALLNLKTEVYAACNALMEA
jgi:hypothetical protein